MLIKTNNWISLYYTIIKLGKQHTTKNQSISNLSHRKTNYYSINKNTKYYNVYNTHTEITNLNYFKSYNVHALNVWMLKRYILQ